MRLICLVILLCANSVLTSSPSDVITNANRLASYQPNPSQFNNAAMIYDWQPNRIYHIYSKPGRISDISLEPGEKITMVAGGDTQRWEISQSESGDKENIRQHVFVKPFQLGISNNLVITTNRRVYHIEMHSLASVPYQAAVSFNYPNSTLIINNINSDKNEKKEEKEINPLSGLKKNTINFNYHFVAKARPEWMPKRVFDDGHKTYIEFPSSMQNSDAPLLWGLTKSKEQQVINYRRYKDFYIIDHLIDIVELSTGGKDPVIVGIEKEA